MSQSDKDLLKAINAAAKTINSNHTKLLHEDFADFVGLSKEAFKDNIYKDETYLDYKKLLFMFNSLKKRPDLKRFKYLQQVIIDIIKQVNENDMLERQKTINGLEVSQLLLNSSQIFLDIYSDIYLSRVEEIIASLFKNDSNAEINILFNNKLTREICNKIIESHRHYENSTVKLENINLFKYEDKSIFEDTLSFILNEELTAYTASNNGFNRLSNASENLLHEYYINNEKDGEGTAKFGEKFNELTLIDSFTK